MNAVKGTSAEEEEHPNTKDWVSSLLKNHGDRLEWINCGLCVDERGAADTVEGPKRGSPKEFAEWVKASDNTVVIPAK